MTKTRTLRNRRTRNRRGGIRKWLTGNDNRLFGNTRKWLFKTFRPRAYHEAEYKKLMAAAEKVEPNFHEKVERLPSPATAQKRRLYKKTRKQERKSFGKYSYSSRSNG